MLKRKVAFPIYPVPRGIEFDQGFQVLKWPLYMVVGKEAVIVLGNPISTIISPFLSSSLDYFLIGPFAQKIPGKLMESEPGH